MLQHHRGKSLAVFYGRERSLPRELGRGTFWLCCRLTRAQYRKEFITAMGCRAFLFVLFVRCERTQSVGKVAAT